MSKPKIKAQNQIVVGPDSDAIHFVDTRGNIIAWIDGTGVLQGNLATTTGGNTNNLQGGPVSPIPPAPNQVLSWNGTTWVPMDVSVNTSLLGNPISSAPPAPNQVLSWTGTDWSPINLPPPPPPGPTNNLQGVPIAAVPPQINQALVWNGVAWTPGAVSTGINFSDAEIPKGPIDGANTAFVLLNVPKPPTSLQVFLNGVLDNGYFLSGATIFYSSPPNVGDTLEAFYRF
jgi:hypothetical protein